jgi:hypothetical protein
VHGKEDDASRILVIKLEGKNHYNDLHAEGKIIVNEILLTLDENMDYMHLAQDKDQRWTFVKTLINFWVP